MSERMAWREGAYAGFWQRVAGNVIDTLILSAVAMIVMVGLFAVLGGAATTSDPAEVEVYAAVVVGVGFIAMFIAFFLYDTLMTSRSGATLGKRAAGIEVRTLDGDVPSFGLATGRFFARYLSSTAFGLGYLWMLWDPQAQTWQDKLCNTVVVKREALMPVGAGWNPQRWQTPAASDQAVGWGTGSGVGTGPGSATGGAWGTPTGATQAPPSGWGAPAGPTQSGSGTPAGPTQSGSGTPAGPTQPGWGTPAGRPGEGALQGETMETATWGRRPSADPSEPSAPPEGAGSVDAAEGSSAPDGPSTAGPSAAPADQPSATDAPGLPGAPPPSDRPDPNIVAISRAAIAPDAATWLQQVAAQVDARLDRVNPSWRSSPQSDAARACAFGILIGHLSRVYPHMADDMGKVAEVHPSFSTLLEGSRLATLVEIAAEPGRATAWLGPLIDVTDRESIGRLLA